MDLGPPALGPQPFGIIEFLIGLGGFVLGVVFLWGGYHLIRMVVHLLL